ncbi:MAG: hypothetical protein DMG70_27265 [Acidobacteria bacterium]|nr:MAG: hypothetical protein DMG70_27265 [Acidobacteriota bacterium]
MGRNLEKQNEPACARSPGHRQDLQPPPWGAGPRRRRHELRGVSRDNLWSAWTQRRREDDLAADAHDLVPSYAGLGFDSRDRRGREAAGSATTDFLGYPGDCRGAAAQRAR